MKCKLKFKIKFATARERSYIWVFRKEAWKANMSALKLHTYTKIKHKLVMEHFQA